MDTSEERMCTACEVAYDWKPVYAERQQYCCFACARGQACTCPEHSNSHDYHAMGSRAGASILGATAGEL